MAKSRNIAFPTEQLTVLADYYRKELKAAETHFENIKKILAKIDGKQIKSPRGRKPNALKAAYSGKKRGPKPGSKRSKPYSGKKRGPKPKTDQNSGE